jgi:sulfonate transport system permease protein
VAQRASFRLSRLGSRAGTVGLELAVPLVVVATWWRLSAGSQSLFFPPLSSIARSFQSQWLFSHFWSDAVPSLANFLGAFVCASVVGVVVGVVIGLSPLLSYAVAPILEFLRAVPGVALLPAAILMFGIGSEMKIILIAWGMVWPILLNTADGVRAIDPVVNDFSRSYQLRRIDHLRTVVLPAASPQIFAGMRTALSIGITVIVFSELYGANSGIGYQLLKAQRSFLISDMWAAMIFLGVIGYGLNLIFVRIENIALGWQRGMQGIGRR